MVRPKYIALDTGTWAKLLRQRTASETKDIIDVLNAGTLIPYVCFEHVLELLQYDNRQVREQRLDFFPQFRLIGFPRHFPSPPWRNSPLCGSYLDVQESEIATLLKDPALSLEQVVDHVRPDAIAPLY